MAEKYKFGIRQKVIILLSVAISLSLFAGGWYTYNKEKNLNMEAFKNNAKETSRFAAKSLESYSISYETLFEELIKISGIIYAKLEDKDDNVINETSDLSDFNQQEMYIVEENIYFNEEVAGKLTVGFNIKLSTEGLILKTRDNLLVHALIVFFVVLGEYFALSKIVINPVREITRALLVKKESNFIAEMPEHTMLSTDEYGLLARILNDRGKRINEINLQLESRVNVADSELIKANLELKGLNEQFRTLAITDGLTGLFNRRQFDDIAYQEISMSIRHGDINSLLLIDIDHFKNVNDKYGHASGDLVLKEVANILKDNTRKTDLICRVGGEEFAVLSRRANYIDSLNVAEKIRRKIESAKMLIDGDNSIEVTISIGVSTIPSKNISNFDELYACADKALYDSKENGRNKSTHIDDINNPINS